MSVIYESDGRYWSAYFSQLKNDRKALEREIQQRIGPLMDIERLTDREIRRLAERVLDSADKPKP